MPILYGDRLIGRIDTRMDRKQGRLMINAVYAEPSASKSREMAPEVASAINQLGIFLGAQEISYGRCVPAAWKSALY
jgi:uncharacterized protein YcaQ